MKSQYSIYGKSEYATMDAKFDVVECLLQDQTKWSSDVLTFAGEYRWIVKLNRLQSWGFNSSRIFPDSPDRFIAWACIGKRSHLAYEITRETNDKIRISPIDFIPDSFKVFTSMALLICFVIPVFFSPIAWEILEASVSRNSKLYLAPFCNFLQNSLIGDEG